VRRAYAAEDLSKADVTLSSNFPVCSLRYATKDVNLIVGGQYNGQVALWDVRRPTKMPAERSVLAKSHADPAYKVRLRRRFAAVPWRDPGRPTHRCVKRPKNNNTQGETTSQLESMATIRSSFCGYNVA